MKHLVFLCIICCCFHDLLAQQGSWKQVSGPYSGVALQTATTASGNQYCLSSQGQCYYYDSALNWSVNPLPVYFYSNQQTNAAFTAVGSDVVLYYNTASNISSNTNFGRGIYRSSDHGKTWTHVLKDSGATTFFNTILQSPSGELYAFRGGSTVENTSIFTSTDQGTTWNLLTAIPLPSSCFAIDAQGNCFFGLGGTKLGIIRYNVIADNYTALMNNGAPTTSTMSLACINGEILVRTDSSLYSITPNGEWHWQTSMPPPFINGGLGSASYSGELLYASYQKNSNSCSLLHSTDKGKTWNEIPMPVNASLSSVSFDSSGIEYMTLYSDATLWRSFDQGKHWEPFGIPQLDIRTLQEGPQHSLFAESYDLTYFGELDWRYARRSFLSIDGGHNWKNSNDMVSGIGTTSFIGGTYADAQGGQYYVSRVVYPYDNYWFGSVFYADKANPTAALNQNDAVYCDQVPLGAGWGNDFFLLAHSPNYEENVALLKTTDHGITWDKMSYPITGAPVRSMSMDNKGSLYIGATSALYRSTDRSGTWEKLSLGAPNARISVIRFFEANTIVVGTLGAGVWVSENRGATWKQWLQSIDTVYGLEMGGSNCYAATKRGLLRCTIGSSDWKPEIPTQGERAAYALLKTSSGQLYVSIEQNGIWTNNTQYTNSSVSVPATILAINSIQVAVNANTLSISFRNTNTGHGTIALYDLLGRKMMTLADEQFTKGPITIRSQIESLPPGTYFVVITGLGEAKTVKVMR